MTQIGILHPGDMGISIAASAKTAGHTVSWVSAGRGQKTRARAEQHGLHDAGTLAELCASCAVIISVCPPHAAEDVAQRVSATGFSGVYVDANAIAPERMQRIAAALHAAGASCIDGGIIGGPAWQPNSTWLYLSGERAGDVAALFAGGPLETQVLGSDIGQASALKMCFAAYSKGSTALLGAVLGAAERLNVREALNAQWARDDAAFPEQTARRVRGVTAKAWRFSGEMDEIAATFQAAGMPGEFHAAAAEIYARLAHFKDAEQLPALAAVLAALIKTKHD